MADEIVFLTLAEVGRQIQSGALSPVALAEACLARVRSHDSLVRSFLHLNEEATLAAAKLAEAEIARGRWRGPVHGVPIGIKDLFDTKDMPTTCNSALFAQRRPRRDAEVVRLLRAGGAIVIGKLAAWECAVGGASFGLPWPPARNPWALDRDPGGSSTGSAAAVAAGFCFGAIGSDTGGSIREPAAWCGIAGLKPTRGLVSEKGGLSASLSLDHVGPMARTSEDCAIMLDAMVGRRRVSFGAGLGLGVAGLRVGVVALDHEQKLALEPDVAASLETAISALRSLGVRLSSVRLPPLAQFSAVVTVLAASEGFAIHREWLQTSPRLYDPLTRQRLMAGARVRAADYVDALSKQSRLTEEVALLMRDVDVLIMPTTARAAPALGGFDSHGGHASLGRPWNVTGYPALSLRSGFDADGLPLAVQLVGRPHQEALVLRVGHALEAALDVGGGRPDLNGPWVEAPRVADPTLSDGEAMETLVALLEEAAACLRSATSRATAFTDAKS